MQRPCLPPHLRGYIKVTLLRLFFGLSLFLSTEVDHTRSALDGDDAPSDPNRSGTGKGFDRASWEKVCLYGALKLQVPGVIYI